MSKPQDPYSNRGPIEYTSISSPVTFSPPIPWIHVASAGSGGLVVKSEDKTSRTYTSLVTGDVLHGPFSEITSMTLTRIRVGDGRPPSSTAPANSNLNGASVADLSAMTTGQVLRATSSTAIGPGAVDLANTNAVTGSLPATNQQRYATTTTQTASWTVAVDILYILNTTNTAATATLPAISASNDGHVAAMFNAGTTAAVWTPASGDTCGGTASSNATLAGPAAGVMKTLVANLATRRWIPLA
jgi:hypothetical protein